MKHNYLLLFILTLLFFSCKKNSESKNQLTDNQKNCIKIYNKILLIPDENQDSLKINAKRIQVLAKNEDNHFKAMAIYIAAKSSKKENFDELSLKQFSEVILLLKLEKNDTVKAEAYGAIGNYYLRKGDYTKSLNNFYNALKIFENNKKYDNASYTKSCIGQVYFQKDDLKNALAYYEKSLESLKNKKSYIYLKILHNFANFYGQSGDIKKAFELDKEGIAICNRLKSNKYLVTFLNNKANCFMYSNQLDSAQFYFDKCLDLDIKSGKKNHIADTYANLAQLNFFKNDLAKAEQFAQKSIALLQEIKEKSYLSSSIDLLAKIQEKKGDYKKALETQRLASKKINEIVNEKTEASAEEYKTIYETEKKEKLLLQKEAEAKQKNTTILIVSLFGLLIGLTLLFIIRSQKQSAKQKSKEFELKQAISKIENQNKLQEQRLEISRDLHDNIGAQLTFITSSVDNIKQAFQLQDEKLNSKLSNISDFAKDTITELRDTIWAMNHDEISIEDLQMRLINFIDKAKESQNKTNFDLNIDNNSLQYKLSSVEGMNVFRIIQEAINNSLKYAKSDKIILNIRKTDSKILIEISDNGLGFNQETIQKGNGLVNMKKRIMEIKGNLNIISSENNGTKIEIEIPANEI